MQELTIRGIGFIREDIPDGIFPDRPKQFLNAFALSTVDRFSGY